MEIRRVQKTGGQSLTVTLPKDWTTNTHVRDKDALKMYRDKRGRLILEPPLYHDTKSIPVVNIAGASLNKTIREITGFYLSGANEIVIRGDHITFEQRAAIRDTSYQLIGFECLESAHDTMTLKNISNTTYGSLLEYLDRMITNIISMYQDLLTAIEKHDTALARDIVERDVEIDRLQLAIVRAFNFYLDQSMLEEHNGFTLLDLHYYEQLGIRLERMADHIVRVANTIIMLSGKFTLIKPEWLEAKRVLDHLHACKRIIETGDKKLAHAYMEANDEREKIRVSRHIAFEKYFNMILHESTHRISSYVANVAEETINYANSLSIIYPNS